MDAAYKAIDSLVRVDAELTDYTVSSVTEGIEALATTRVVIRPSGKMSNEGFVQHAHSGKVQRSFSGRLGWSVLPTANRLLPKCVYGSACCIVMAV